MVPCSLLAENIFSVFRSPHLPLDTLIKKSSCTVAGRFITNKKSPATAGLIKKSSCSDLGRQASPLQHVLLLIKKSPATAGLIKKSSCSDLGRQASPLQHELGSGSPAFRGTYRE